MGEVCVDVQQKYYQSSRLFFWIRGGFVNESLYRYRKVLKDYYESLSVVSDSLRSHGLYIPQNSPGQNTGVGSLSLLQGIYLPNPGIEPRSPTLQVDSLPSEPLEKLPEVETPLGHFRGMTLAGLSNSPNSHLLIPTGPGLWDAKMRSQM